LGGKEKRKKGSAVSLQSFSVTERGREKKKGKRRGPSSHGLIPLVGRKKKDIPKGRGGGDFFNFL